MLPVSVVFFYGMGIVILWMCILRLKYAVFVCLFVISQVVAHLIDSFSIKIVQLALLSLFFAMALLFSLKQLLINSMQLLLLLFQSVLSSSGQFVRMSC